MKRMKKASGEYATKGTDVVDGDILIIEDEGTDQDSQYGVQFVMKMKTRNGSKLVRVNTTSENNLIDAFGDDSANWVGKEVKAWLINTMVSGKMSKVLYVSHKDSIMDDNGNFSKPTAGTPETGDTELDSLAQGL